MHRFGLLEKMVYSQHLIQYLPGEVVLVPKAVLRNKKVSNNVRRNPYGVVVFCGEALRGFRWRLAILGWFDAPLTLSRECYVR